MRQKDQHRGQMNAIVDRRLDHETVIAVLAVLNNIAGYINYRRGVGVAESCYTAMIYAYN